MPGLGLLIFVLVEHAGPEAFPWTVRSDGPGVVNYESPTSRKPLLDWKAYRVVNKPIRPFGIMSSLVLARALGSYQPAPRPARVEKAIRILRSSRISRAGAPAGCCGTKRRRSAYRFG